MIQKLDHAWVKEIFTLDGLRQYATFETELKANVTSEKKAAFEKNWADLVADIKHNIYKDPTSAIGITLGEKCMVLINDLYGKKYIHLRTKIFEKGLGEEKRLKKVGLSPAMVSWLEKATNTYWQNRIRTIFEQVGTMPSDMILKLRNEALDDMYGQDAEYKKIVREKALADVKVSEKAKE